MEARATREDALSPLNAGLNLPTHPKAGPQKASLFTFRYVFITISEFFLQSRCGPFPKLSSGGIQHELRRAS